MDDDQKVVDSTEQSKEEEGKGVEVVQEASPAISVSPGELHEIRENEEKITLEEVHKDTQAILDATKELTKITGELSKEFDKFRKAGKF